MSHTPETVTRFFQAMQRGAAAEREMEALFADTAIYIEPFSGTPQSHVGKKAIMETMRAGWQHPLPNMTITIDEVNVDGAEIAVKWTCKSPALPGGKGAGLNRFTLRNGLIERLETTFA